MITLRESYLYRLWLTLCGIYGSSGVHRILVRLGAWCNRQIDESAVLAVLCREGAVARAWPESRLCALLTQLLNLPAALLHRLYRAMPRTFEDSFFARLAFQMGEETAIAQFWVIALLWVIPFSRWNNAYSLMGFGALLVLFHGGAMRRSSFRLDLRSIGFYPLVLFAAMFLAVAFSYAPALSLRFLGYHISAALCVLVTVSAVRSGEDLKRLAAGGSICVLVSSLYGVYQRIQGVEVNKSYVDLTVNAGMPGRVESFFDNPNTFAEVLLLLLPLVAALVLCARRPMWKAAACGILAVGAAAMGMTYSRASWVGLACAMVVMVFLWRPRLIPGFAVICVLCMPLLPDTIWNRILTITNTSDSSTASRFPLYEAALEVIQTSPVSGAGLGTAATQAFIKDFNLYHGKAPFVHAHNFFLEVWIEAGLLGITGFVGAMLWNIKKAAASRALSAPCCGTSKRRPTPSGTAATPQPAPLPAPPVPPSAAPWSAAWRIICGTIPGSCASSGSSLPWPWPA